MSASIENMSFKQLTTYQRTIKKLCIVSIDYNIKHIRYLNNLKATTDNIELLEGYNKTILKEKKEILKNLLTLKNKMI